MGAAVLAIGLIMRSARDSGVGTPNPQQALPAPVLARPTLPPHFEANLREKLTLLEADLARDPRNPGLLAAAALTSLSLSVATHHTAPDDPAVRKAEQWAAMLGQDQRPSAAQIELMVRDAPSLEWTAPAGISLPASLWPLRVGRSSLFSEPNPTPRGSLLTSGRFFAPVPNGVRPLPQPGDSLRMRGTARSQTGRPPAYGEAEVAHDVARLRERFGANPQNLVAGEQLGQALFAAAGLSEQAELMADPKSGSHAPGYRDEATRLYKTLAARSRTHSQRAAFLEAAAEVRRSANDWDSTYQLLKEAVQLAPFSPRMWKELQDAALQAGRLDEAEAARFHAREWSFPELHSPNGFPAEPPRWMPEMPPAGPGRNGPN